MTDTIRFTVPLPPTALRSNARAHWAAKKKAADEYSLAVFAAYVAAPDAKKMLLQKSWTKARVTYTWRYCGVAPDHSNLGGNTKYLQDIICRPPVNCGTDRWYLGIIENDSGI